MIKSTFLKTSRNISSHCLDEGEKAKGKVGQRERGEAEHSVKKVSTSVKQRCNKVYKIQQQKVSKSVPNKGKVCKRERGEAEHSVKEV